MSSRIILALKILVFLGCLVPLVRLLYLAYMGDLGANPIEFLTHSTGKTALILLMITLAVSPARRLLAQPWLIRFRRMLGLFAFFYVCLHFLIYVVLDHFFNWHRIVADVAKRPYITAGFTAFLLLIPLAVTSTQGWIRRLGGKGWQRLHRLIYVSAGLGVVHFLWLVKADLREPLIYASILGVLMGIRLVLWLRRQVSPVRAQQRQVQT